MRNEKRIIYLGCWFMPQGFLFYITILGALGSIAAIVSAICDVITVRRGQPGNAPDRPPMRRTYIVMAVFLLLVWGAIGFDYYDRHYAKKGELLMADVGVLSGNRVFAVVNTRSLVSMAKDHYIMLILRVEDNQTDLWLDGRLEKSTRFSITGRPVQIELVPSTPFILRVGKGQNVDYFLLLMPQRVDIDQILSLSHAEELGGQVLNQATVFVSQQVFDPPAAPAAQ